MDIIEAELRQAREQLRAAGVPEGQIPPLVERAALLRRGLAELATLDVELPEPALIWQPLGEVTP